MFGWGKKQKAEKIFERIQIIINDIEINWNMFTSADRIVKYSKETEADLVGACVYYVAGAYSAKVATEITNLYKKMLIDSQYAEADLLQRVNSAYQKIRGVTDSVQLKATSMTDIFTAQSECVADLIGLEPNDNNLDLLIGVLSNFCMYLKEK